MVGTLIKQPNEKYCIVDYAGEIRRYNLTEQDIIDIYIEDAKACIGAAEHYGNIVAETVRFGCKPVSNKTLNEMGFNVEECMEYVAESGGIEMFDYEP